jgi:16S rRNA (guanine966-N2)-methyltransferase
MLTHLNVIHNARVLDLFAGTGALGLEALSRGAKDVVFVENGRVAQKLIAQNVEKVRAEAKTSVMRNDATTLGAWAAAPFDLVFLDPPYGKGMGQQALAATRTNGWLAQGALIVWEESTPMEAPEGFKRTDRRKYGSTHVTFLTCD